MSEAARLHNEIRDLEFYRRQLGCEAAIVARCADGLRSIYPNDALLQLLERRRARVENYCDLADEMIDELRGELSAIEEAHISACRERYWLQCGELR